LQKIATSAVGPNEPMLTSATSEAASTAFEAAVIVEAPVAKVYKQWVRVEDYPKFLPVIKTVRKVDARHFAVHGGVNGQQFNAMLEIVLRIPERRVAWRLLHDHLTAGVVSFTSISCGRTRVTLKMMSSFSGSWAECVDTYLQGFKNVVERA
jgi:uncharacterized membrane protein